MVAAVATVITLNADAYDAARWSAGDKAVAAGVPATMVDAGFEWVGSHQSAVALPGRRVPGSPFYETKNSGSQSARISTSTWFANLAASRTGRTRGAWLRPAVQEPE